MPSGAEHGSTKPRCLDIALNEDSLFLPEDDVEALPDHHFTTSGIVTIFVGTERKKYEVHQELLCTKSPYFKSCLQPYFREGACGQISLDADAPEAFDVAMTWIYQDRVSWENLDSAERYTNAYAMADKLMMPGLKNAICDACRARSSSFSDFERLRMLRVLFDRDMVDQPLLAFMIQSFIWRYMRKPLSSSVKSEQFDELENSLLNNAKFCRLILLDMIKFRIDQGENPARASRCCYHDHGDGSSC